ncbi:hypothetical protein QWY75_06315 [Pontixanthobacter aestiaquae]|uniref:Lipoprotein n=1 Tax=Pontixanthobacter aestiaquae TaxID=1509367 RepID=A0A844Z3B9_9SPHN|nr:hypothetical protein [Pontixanthobacter aestiaquae]MDN3645814.1 hypothetical protein [Pontixanthobacter aestiaquae]MXO83191.1 hypothetical protein [Pontixanthobacter aestiaquae]
MQNRFLLTTAHLPLLALAACGDSPADGESGAADPATEQALNEQIMVDPDLANQNEANAALTGGTDQSIPPENMTPEAIQAARDAAFALVGGSDGLTELPAPTQYSYPIPETATLTAASKAAITADGTKCAENVTYSASWAAKLPAIFPVYPRGATKDAAGTDQGDCALRAITFLTPVPLEEVLTFYYSRAKTAGYTTEYAVADQDTIVSGVKGGASYVVYGRRLSSGLTEIDLITNGL